MRKNKRSNPTEVAIKAMHQAVKMALIERKRLGVSFSVWENGKVATFPASKITAKFLRDYDKKSLRYLAEYCK